MYTYTFTPNESELGRRLEIIVKHPHRRNEPVKDTATLIAILTKFSTAKGTCVFDLLVTSVDSTYLRNNLVDEKRPAMLAGKKRVAGKISVDDGMIALRRNNREIAQLGYITSINILP